MRRTGGTWATVGLVVLGVVAAVLAFAALRSTQATPTPAPTASALATPNEEEKPGKDNTSDSEPPTTDSLPKVIEPPLLMVDTEVAYRGSTGTCLGGASLERTANGGKTWRPLESPAEAILDLRTTGADSVEVVGADERCRVRSWASVDQGQTWSEPISASNIFVRLPETTRDIATPSGVVKNPCPDRDVAPLAIEEVSEAEGVVLCGGGEVVTTADGGVTWQPRAQVAGAQAVAFDGANLGWVLVGDGGRCPNLEAQVTQDGGTTWNLAGCLGDSTLVDDRVLPSLSFASPAEGLADVAGQSWLTTDGGLAWQLPR